LTISWLIGSQFVALSFHSNNPYFVAFIAILYFQSGPQPTICQSIASPTHI